MQGREPDLRTVALQHFERGKLTNYRPHRIQDYNTSLILYEKVPDLNIYDFKTLIQICHLLGTNQFNENLYNDAANSYLRGIYYSEKLISLTPEDPLYDEYIRELIGLYIDLSDTYMEINPSMNQKAAEFFEKAIFAFKFRIKNKTETELALGDVAVNYQGLHQFYERKLSAKSYRKSQLFKENASTVYETRNSEDFQINNMFGLFTTVNIQNPGPVTHTTQNPFVEREGEANYSYSYFGHN